MTQVTFYQLGEDHQGQSSLMALACQLATDCYRNRQRCLVLCDSKQQAEQFDELLWQLPADAFVPHNLSGEGPANGAAVEIAWQNPRQVNRPAVINLTQGLPENFQRYQQVYEFAPVEEEQKQLARNRFKQYRMAGNNPQFVPVSSSNERHDG